MIGEKDLKKFFALRKILFDYIEEELIVNGYCKSYEGELEITIHFPNFFEKSDVPAYNIHLDCYVVGPARHYDWEGNTLSECLDKFEKSLREWISVWDDGITY